MTVPTAPTVDSVTAADGHRFELDRAHDPLVELRAGIDLVVSAYAVKPANGDRASSRWVILAADAQGSTLTTLCTCRSAQAMHDVWPTAVAAAVRLYPKRAAAVWDSEEV